MSNEELQKAIDDITNEGGDNADGAIAPATPAPEAAAQSEKKVDAPESGDKKADAPEEILPPAPAPEIPNTPMPEDMMPAPETAAKAMPENDAAAAAADAQPIAAPAPAPEVPTPAPAPAEDIVLEEEALIKEPTVAQMAEKMATSGNHVPNSEPAANLTKVKQDALRELFPLMDKLNIDPVQKFGLYKDIIATTHEQSAIEEAHEAIKAIDDEQTRADALLELLQIIAEHQ